LIGISRHFLKPRTSIEGRLRLVVVVALLGLPLAVGIWAFAEVAGRNARDRADAQLAAVLRSALQVYTGSLESAQARAASTAARRDVQVALARGDRRTLARIAAGAGVSFALTRGARPVGTVPPRAATRSVAVDVGRRRVGRVTAFVPLDAALLRRLGKAAALPAGDRLVFRPGAARSQPLTVRVGAAGYRTAAVLVDAGATPTSLLALAPSSRIDESAAGARNRVLLPGLVSLGCLGLLVYVFAPVLARGRLLRGQRDQAARVLGHLAEGVFLVDDGGVVRLWNHSAETITGLAASAVAGRAAADVVPGWAELRDRVPVGGEGGQAVAFGVELRGQERWLSISGARFSEGTVYAFRDLTEERRLEQMRSDFVATVSHELRTPLASIHGAVLTLSKRRAELEPALQDRLLGIVVGQSERLSELVEQILLAAQLDSGGLQFAAEPFDGDELARTVIDAAQPRVPAGVTVGLTSSGAADVLGDASKARLVLGNLLDNAVKYSPDGGRIDVVVTRGAHGVRFTVRDEGLGIPVDEQERIFEKFYRLDASMTRGVGGSGLGLYICRELVRGMGGRIWVASAPGAGSAFTFELPFAERQAATA
jgi:two-component system phosphate regulon sensor histidine kinase PhoR